MSPKQSLFNKKTSTSLRLRDPSRGAVRVSEMNRLLSRVTYEIRDLLVMRLRKTGWGRYVTSRRASLLTRSNRYL